MLIVRPPEPLSGSEGVMLNTAATTDGSVTAPLDGDNSDASLYGERLPNNFFTSNYLVS